MSLNPTSASLPSPWKFTSSLERSPSDSKTLTPVIFPCASPTMFPNMSHLLDIDTARDGSQNLANSTRSPCSSRYPSSLGPPQGNVKSLFRQGVPFRRAYDL